MATPPPPPAGPEMGSAAPLSDAKMLASLLSLGRHDALWGPMLANAPMVPLISTAMTLLILTVLPAASPPPEVSMACCCCW